MPAPPLPPLRRAYCPGVGAVIRYTPAEAGMRRLIMIREHLGVLCRLFENGAAPSLAFHYGVLRLVQFLDAYEDFMGSLDPQQQRRVACVAGLVSDVHKHGGSLSRLRNGWIAHLPDDDLLAADTSAFFRRVGLPRDPAAYYEMLMRTIIFIDTARALLPGIAKPAVEKFNRTGDAEPNWHLVVLGRAHQSLRASLDGVLKNAKQKCPDVEWDSLLGAAGVRLDRLGPADPGAGADRGGGRRKGGEDRQ